MKKAWLTLLGVALLGVLLLLSLGFGAVSLTPREVLEGLLGQGSPTQVAIIRELRLPRSLMAVVCGAILAASGVISQAILRNPMAAPSLIGISTGASVTAALAIVVPLPFALPLIWTVPIFAFIGSALSAFAVFALASGRGRTDVGLLLLAGVAINSLAGAGTGLLTFLADDPQLRNITFWSLGSVAGAEWSQIFTLFLFSIPLIISSFRSGSVLNAWSLGESEAKLLGVNVEREKLMQIIAISLSVGAAVAFTGVIGFIGLVVPHLLRMAQGSDHKSLLPQSLLWGANLLLASDLIARLVIIPKELPIGIVTALIGAPYFIYLLRQHFRKVHAV